MTPHLSTLRQRPGIFRLALLLLSVLALIFAIVDIILQSTDDFVAFEAIGPVFLSLTSFCWTLAWSISAICALLFHGPYPAGVDVGLDFIGWGLAWGFGVTLLTWVGEMSYTRSCGRDDAYDYYSDGYCVRARALMASEVLAGVFAMIYGALHCWMMISAIRTLIAIRRVVRNKAVDSELHDGEHLTA